MAKIVPTNADGFALVLSKIKKIDLAKHLGVTKQALTNWQTVPLRHVNDTSRITGIPVESIIPEQARHVSTVLGRDCGPILGELIKGFY